MKEHFVSSSASSASEEETDDAVDGNEKESQKTVREAHIYGNLEGADLPQHDRSRYGVVSTLAVVTLIVGVFVLMWRENLRFVEAMYVTTQIVTTIGYGDITFTDRSMRLFMAFYVLWMLVLVGFFLNAAIQSVIQAHAEHLKGYLREVENWAEHFQLSQMSSNHEDGLQIPDQVELRKKYGDLNSLVYATAVFLLHLAFGTIFFAHVESCTCSYGMTAVKGCTQEDACNVGSQKTYSDAFYMSVVTLTTVGFGDLTPSTWVGRLVGIPWMLSGIVSTAFFLEAMQKVFLKMEARERFDEAETMSEEKFKAMDRDGNGVLTKAEFVNYNLVKHNIVDRETLDGLYRIFDSMVKSNANAVTFEEVKQFQCQLNFQAHAKSGKEAKTKRQS